ncbi:MULTISPECIES: glycerate kinase family protein [Cytobacillus]|uniref:glycerate kinase family protein n=1 Tax=Cytobacillus TaxID=2675230 RepID=UPI00203FC8A9|nr:glycerate kinase [Cytobacillus firmus]MCM3706453.1 glycerate kinase [Cytobacillus firmus]
MKVVIAVDSFKGSVSSLQAGEAIKKGVLDSRPDASVEVCPMADGGEGTVEALIHSKGGTRRSVCVHGPLMEKVTAEYIVFPYQGKDHVFIESASSCGLTLIPAERRNPMKTNTFGVGEQIRDAIENGYRHFFLSLGGSATNDGGTGMLQALGWEFFDEKGDVISKEGNPLLNIASMSSEKTLKELEDCSFTIASDVMNPFYGMDGAAHIFARQKGANDSEILILDEALERLCEVYFRVTGKNVQGIPGAGAAGGLGGAMSACLNAIMQSGAEILMDITGLKGKIQEADIVFTGEGSLDHQSLLGKVPVTIAKYAKLHNKKVIGLAGRIDTELKEMNEYLDAVFSIQTECRMLDEAMLPAITLNQLAVTASQVIRAIR